MWVIVLSTITLFVYAWFWWYFINRELRDLGRARGSTELGDNPTLSVLAVSLGALIIVPPFVSAYNTCKRIQAAQRLGGEREPLNGWLALALFAAMFFVYIPFAFGYIQSELNKVWRNQELTDPLSPELIHPGAMTRSRRRRGPRRPRSRTSPPGRFRPRASSATSRSPAAGRGCPGQLVPRPLEPGPAALLGRQRLDRPHGRLSSPGAGAGKLR